MSSFSASNFSLPSVNRRTSLSEVTRPAPARERASAISEYLSGRYEQNPPAYSSGMCEPSSDLKACLG